MESGAMLGTIRADPVNSFFSLSIQSFTFGAGGPELCSTLD
jgi:hypothetical protein